MRKNYSRLEFKDKHKMLKEIEQDDNDMVQEFCHYSANDTDEVLCFLEGLFSKGWSPSCVVLQRTLIVALALLARIKAIQLEFKDVNALESASDICDCGYSEMGNNNLANRLRGLVAKVCVCLKGNNNENRKLKESVLSMKLLLAVVACSLACDAGALRMMPDAEMLAQILAL